jgi:hypothetical protein
MASDDLWCLYKHHVLCLTRHLGHSYGVEVDLLCIEWMRWWIERIDFCVSAGHSLPFALTRSFCINNKNNSWAHEICSRDNEERAIVTATMNEMAYVIQAWLPLLVWQQIDAPQYHKGFITVTCLSVCIIITALSTRFLHQRENRWHEKQGVESEAEGYDTGIETPPQQIVEVQAGGKAYV